jgi:ABC-type sugar transport system substrate-binding protein
MKRRVGTLACLIALLAFTLTGRAGAQGARSRVAVVRTSSGDRLLREANTRLRAELVAAGFDVIDVERVPGDPRTQVELASARGRRQTCGSVIT